MTDKYTKTVLSIIAIALVTIAIKLGAPQPAHAWGTITAEEFRDGDRAELLWKLPAVWAVKANCG